MDIPAIPTIVLPRTSTTSSSKVQTQAVVEKRTEEYDIYRAAPLSLGLKDWEADRKAAHDVRPYERVEGDFNAMVDAGINALLLLLVGGGGTAFNNANAFLGVGASTTAWATTQTDLLTTPTRKAMKATYPQTGTKLQTFQSDFPTAEANIAWQEWGIFNATSAGTMLEPQGRIAGHQVDGDVDPDGHLRSRRNPRR